jgi:hypothetical protein
MGKLRRPPALGDPGPDGMTMPPPFLLMKNQRARLAFQFGKLRLDQIRRPLEFLDGGVVAFRRIQAHGKKRLLATGACGGGFNLAERARKVIREKPPDLVQFDMIVVAGVHQVDGKRLPSPALIALDNHGSRSGRRRIVGRREAKGANEHVADHADVVAGLFQQAAVGPASGIGGAGKLVHVRADLSEGSENLGQ